MYEDILYEVKDPVAIITLNRPDSMNAWTATMGREIREAITRADADPTVVGIVITGAGRAFCAGADMKLLNALTDEPTSDESFEGTSSIASSEDGGQSEAVNEDFNGRFTYLMGLSKPVIAAVNGPVAGMAFPFSLCCDMRVVTTDSLFLTAFAQRGLIAEQGLGWLLPKLVGPSVAMDLLMSSRKVRGEEAYRVGLANYLVEPDELLPFCIDYIEKLAANCSPLSMAIMKRQVYQDFHQGLGQAETQADVLMHESLTRDDFKEGVKSFLQKRKPAFSRLPKAANDGGKA